MKTMKRKNVIRTSQKQAAIASKILSNPKALKQFKSVAASALANRKKRG
jgi:hypothetical protein